jgi:hypothetical protein
MMVLLCQDPASTGSYLGGDELVPCLALFGLGLLSFELLQELAHRAIRIQAESERSACRSSF